MGHSYLIMILLGVGLFFGTDYAFADPHTIETANDSGLNLECGTQCYTPNTLTVDVGHVITMTNTDSSVHTFTSGNVYGFAATPDGEFDSGLLMQGDSFEFISNIPDVYPYYCMLHVWMQGTIIVVEAEVTPPSISVWSDKSSYEEGDVIKISGKVTNPTSTSLVNIILKAPNGNLVSISQSSLNYDHTFSTTIIAGGTLMVTSGTYLFNVGYESVSNSGSFYYSASETPTPTYTPPTSDSGHIGISGSSDLVGYEITGGKLLSIITDVDANLLIVRISATDYGSLTLTIPRSVLDSKLYNGSDDDFFVIVDGEEVDFDEIISSTDRILTIQFPRGAEQIEIIGTYVVSSYTPPTYTPPTYTPPTYPPPTYDTTPPKILKPTDIVENAEDPSGTRVAFDVLAIDNIDQLVRPTCNPSSGAFFSVGITTVTCNAKDSAGNRAPSVSFSVTVIPPKVAIPDWVKNVALFWCENKIADTEFIDGIEYLIDNNIIIVSTTSGYGSSQEIPNWVKNNACWWSQDLITSDDFASGIEYLVQKGIIRV